MGTSGMAEKSELDPGKTKSLCPIWFRFGALFVTLRLGGVWMLRAFNSGVQLPKPPIRRNLTLGMSLQKWPGFVQGDLWTPTLIFPVDSGLDEKSELDSGKTSSVPEWIGHKKDTTLFV